jgi:DnaK suppressor protein
MRKMELVDRERHEVLKDMLQDRAREITDKLRTMRETLPDELADVKDPEEQCVHEFVQGLDFALIEMKSHTLGRINDALQRLELGSYGLCSDCDEAISSARLEALPFAERCRNCQESREELAADAAKQQSRFELPRLDAQPTDTPAAPASAPARPSRPAEGRAARPTSLRPSPEPARKARPGQLALRRAVAAMERASKLLLPQPSSPAAAPARPAPSGRARALVARGRRAGSRTKPV